MLYLHPLDEHENQFLVIEYRILRFYSAFNSINILWRKSVMKLLFL